MNLFLQDDSLFIPYFECSRVSRRGEVPIGPEFFERLPRREFASVSLVADVQGL
jgi:hypothetical protein